MKMPPALVVVVFVSSLAYLGSGLRQENRK